MLALGALGQVSGYDGGVQAVSDVSLSTSSKMNKVPVPLKGLCSAMPVDQYTNSSIRCA